MLNRDNLGNAEKNRIKIILLDGEGKAVSGENALRVIRVRRSF